MAQFANRAKGSDSHRLLSAATTNATSVKTSAGRVASWVIYNANAAVRYLKLYDSAVAPTAGAGTPMLTVPLAPGSVQVMNFGDNGPAFGSGLGYTIVTGVADSDVAAVAANEIVVNLFYR